MNFQDFIQHIRTTLSSRLQSYAGGFFVDVVYNRPGNLISVIWARYLDGQTEIYNFSVIDGSKYTELVNDGHDFTDYGQKLIHDIFIHMVEVESKQTGRPPAI